MYCLEKLVRKFQRARLVAFLGSTPELYRDTRALIWSFQRNEWRVDEDPLPLVDRIPLIVETDYGMDEEEFWELCERYEGEAYLEDEVRLDAIQNLYDLIEDDFRPGVFVAYLNGDHLCFQDDYSQYPYISRDMAMSLEHTAREFAKYVNPELYREYLEEPDSSGDSEDDDSNGDIRSQMIDDYLNDPWGGGDPWGNVSYMYESPRWVGYLIPCTLSLLGYGDDEKNMESIMGLKKDEFLSAFRDVVTKVWLPEVIRRLTEYRD